MSPLRPVHQDFPFSVDTWTHETRNKAQFLTHVHTVRFIGVHRARGGVTLRPFRALTCCPLAPWPGPHRGH